MYIDKMTRKEKIDFVKSEINKAPEEELDEILFGFGLEYSDEYLDDLEEEEF